MKATGHRELTQTVRPFVISKHEENEQENRNVPINVKYCEKYLHVNSKETYFFLCVLSSLYLLTGNIADFQGFERRKTQEIGNIRRLEVKRRISVHTLVWYYSL